MLIEIRFCEQDEEHDPGEEFEEYMACSVCGDKCKCERDDDGEEQAL